MPRSAPAIENDVLVIKTDYCEASINVGTPEWFEWLLNATSFYYISPKGNYSACKENRPGDMNYWKAYCTRAGRMKRAYLGKSEALSVQKLHGVADLFSENAAGVYKKKNSMDELSGTGKSREMDASSMQPFQYAMIKGRSGNAILFSEVKISHPPVQPYAVERPRLENRLNEGLSRQLTLVSAPAGSGKTTLLSQWAASLSCPVAWVSLDRTEDDLLRFWAYITAAIQKVYPDFGKSILALLDAPISPSGESIVTLISNEMLARTEKLLLVLDDYHRIHSPAVQQSMALFLDYLPSDAHVIISTREEPSLPIVRLRARAQLVEIKAEELALTDEEASCFLNEFMKKNLTSSQVMKLVDFTEGWVTGLQLAALSIHKPGDADELVRTFASNRDLVDYLTEEVLQGQPERIRKFLLYSSILNRFSAPLCAAVTGEEESQLILESLEKENLFIIPLDNSRQWYRYHSLFAKSMRFNLGKVEPETVLSIQRKASRWLFENDFYEDALSQALAIPDFEFAAEIIEKVAPSLLMRRQIRVLMGYLDKLPETIIQQHPRLCLYLARSMIFTGDVAGASIWLQYAEKTLTNKRNEIITQNGMSDSSPLGLLDEVVRLRKAIEAGQGDLFSILPMVYQLQTNYQSQAGPDMLVKPGFNFIHGGFYLNNISADKISRMSDNVLIFTLMGALYCLAGNLHESFDLYWHSSNLAGSVDPTASLVMGDSLSGLAMIAYEWNDLDSAVEHAQNGIETNTKAGFTANVFFSTLQLANTRWAQGQCEEAFRLLGQAELIANDNSLPEGSEITRALRARFLLRQGNTEAAIQTVGTISWVADEKLSSLHLIHYFEAIALVQAAHGEIEEAEKLLDKALTVSESKGWQWSTIHTLAAQAMIAQSNGEVNKALSILARALSIAQTEGYIRTFIDYGRLMENLLKKIMRSRRGGQIALPGGISIDYVSRLLAAFNKENKIEEIGHEVSSSVNQQNAAFDCLTVREEEVLHLILDGNLNAEIAKKLIIEESTVKKHINSIYGKLNVHSRAQLIRLAKEKISDY